LEMGRIDRKDSGLRSSADGCLVLRNCVGSASVLMRVKTGNRSRRKTRAELKEELAGWMQNSGFDQYRKQSLDLAIVVKLDERRIKDQDVDNIAKRVLDALQKARNDPAKMPHLFIDDSQVARLLVYKRPRKEIQGSLTDEVTISFRKHDPGEKMILEAQRTV